MAVLLVAVWLSLLSGCLTQTTTQYIIQGPQFTGTESAGIVEVCLSRTGDDISAPGTVYLTTEDDSAISTQDYTALVRFEVDFGANVKDTCFDITITDDNAVEFDERFTLNIDGATDGVAGSQNSTEIVIEANDYCRSIPIVPPVSGMYVAPVTPVAGMPIVYTNTILLDHTLVIYLASTTDLTDNYYSIEFEQGVNMGQFSYESLKNGQSSTIQPAGLNVLQSNADDTVDIFYDPATGTVRLEFSEVADVLDFPDNNGSPLTIRHIFAIVGEPGLGPGDFTVCGNVLPVPLPPIANGETQSETSQTYVDAGASRAVDGNVDSVVAGDDGTCSVTGNVEDPWLRVDLGKEHEIFGVELYSVADADPSGLSDLAGVEVYIGSCSDPGYIDQQHLCGTAPADVTPDSDPGMSDNARLPAFVECTASTYPFGRYVYVRRNTADAVTGTLAICEIRIYGKEVPFDMDSTVSFSIDALTVAETEDNVTVIVEHSGPGATCNSVDLYSEDDTAKTSGLNSGLMDFTDIPQATPRTIQFYPDVPMQSVDVDINQDTICEEDEQFKLHLTNVDVGVIGTPSTTEVTITDNDLTEYAIEDASEGFEIREGDGPLEITILRNGSEQVLEAEGSVLFRSEVGTPSSETVTFSAGDTEEEVNIELPEDNVWKPNTTFTVSLETIGLCSVLQDGAGEATVTLQDDDSRFYFDDYSIDDGEISKSEFNTGTFQIRVKRDGVARRKTVGVSVHYSLSDEYDNAQEGVDFSVSTTSLTFEIGDDEEYVTVTINDDSMRENEESFDLLLTDPYGIPQNLKDPYRITVVTEDDDDVFRFDPTFYRVSEAQQSVDVCLRRSGALTKTTTIILNTQDQTAIEGRDYSASANGLYVVFQSEMDTACATISILPDFVAEESEAFLVYIASNDVDTQFNTRATVSISDDPDVFIGFALEEYIVDEDDQILTVEITKSGDIQQSVSAVITSYAQSADAYDYVEVINEGIRIPSGIGSISFEVTIRDDEEDENNEQFQLTLSNPSTGILSGPTTTVTIRDDDSDHLRPDGGPAGISNGALAGIIVAAVVTVLVAALGMAIVCVFLLRRRVQPVVMAAPPPQPQVPVRGYPEYGYRNGGRVAYGQPIAYR